MGRKKMLFFLEEFRQMYKTEVKMLFVALFWGGAFATGKLAVAEMHPIAVAFYRFFLTGLCLLPLMLWKDRGRYKLEREDWPWMLLLGITGVFAYNAFFFMGLKYSTAINATAIVAAVPILTTLLNAILYKERVVLRQVIGIAVSFFGVITVVTRGEYLALKLNTGDMYLLGCLLCWSIYTLAGKKVMRKYTALTSTTYAVVIGTLLLAPFAFWYGASSPSSSVVAWGSIIYMAIFSSVISFVWWYSGVKEIGPTRTVIFLNLVPIFAITGALFVGETMSFPQFVGILVVITGVVLTNLPSKKPVPVIKEATL
jgi:drug/metabolite transporter (DMT)-like permease